MASDLFVRAHQKDAIKATNRHGLDSENMDRDARLENDEDYYGYGIGGNIKAVGKDSGKRLIISGTNRPVLFGLLMDLVSVILKSHFFRDQRKLSIL